MVSLSNHVATVLRQAQDKRVVNFHNFEKALPSGAGPFYSPSPLVGEGWGEGYSLPQDSSLSHTFTLTLTLSHQGRGDFL